MQHIRLWATALLYAGVFALDIYHPLGVAAGIAYIPVVFCSTWFRGATMPFIFAGGASVLTIAGYFLSSDVAIEEGYAILNRVLSLIGVWVVAVIVSLQKNTLEKLAESEGRFSNVINSAVDGMITIDEQGTVELFNPACERIFGYTAKEVVGHNIKMLMPEPYHGEHDGYLRQYCTTGERKIIGIGRDVEGRRKDGSTFPMRLAVSELRLGERRLFAGILRDITVEKKSEEEREQLIEKLAQSNEELERFAYVASHDLQEPLRMVRSFTNLLAEQYGEQLDEQAQEYINFAASSAERMQQLVEDLLEYARIGEEAERHESVDVHNILEYVQQNLRESMEEAGAEITHDPLPVIVLNPVRFSRLLQNLVGNAMKYQKQGNAPRIHIAVEDTPEEWVFSVQDNGIGMKHEYCEKIFSPFKRLHGRDEYSGTGMGLAITKKIVENFGGRIWAESELGKGSTFFFTVPKQLANTTTPLEEEEVA